MARFRWPLLLALLLSSAVQPAAAQVGSTTDIITGKVTGPDGEPIADATVEAVSTETQVSRQRTTDAHGRFTIVFPDGGGQYQLSVRYIGMAPLHMMLARQADEDRLVANVRMSSAATQLEEITVRGRTPRPREGDRAGPGEAERNLNPELVDRLPIDASDPSVLATLAPGVVAIGATDSTSSAFSVAGLRPDANNITLDGLSAGSATVPQDAIRNTRVVTSSYDVARGQFSGGLVASTTRSGTNVPQGSFTYNLRDRSFAWGGATSSAFGEGFTQNQLGGGMGGPIVRNRLFVFGSLQGRWRDDGLTSLSSADPATLARLGVSGDSAARFVSLAGATGVPATLPLIPSDRGNDNTSGLVRVDWKPSDAQTLTLRLDGRWTSQDPTRIGSLSLPATGGSNSGHGGGVLASLTSYFGGNFINDFRGYLSTDHREGTAYLTLPQGRVQVASEASDTTRGVVTFGFGGNAGFPQSSDNTGVELTEELSWLPGAATHRIKLGLFLNASHFHQTQTPNGFGTFTYPSLAALEAGEPSQFTRNLVPQEHAGTAWNGAAYLGDTWRGGGLQLAYGVRVETGAFGGAPAYNPTVDSVFGLRTDHIPTDFTVSPRAGFTWTIGGVAPGGGGGRGFGGSATTILRGGVGEFRSPTPTGLYSSALAAPGLSTAESQLVCVGSAVPIPDWTSYLSDPSVIPRECVDTVTTVPISPHPNATIFDPGFTAPRAWRGSLGIQRRVLGTFTISLDASYARGVSQYGFRDLNLASSPSFTLPAEGGRPVYVPAAAIVPGTGALSLTDSRVDPEFGQVLEIESNLASDTKQVTAAIGGITGRGATFQLSYTYTRARDQSSFSGGGATQGFAAATTAGDPNLREWATSNFERRHSVLATITYPVTGGLEVTAIGRLSSGVPFTPLVGSDINGDGARNDRAFIFDPASTADPVLASGIQSLLATAPSSVRDCLESQLGGVAGRNSCHGPWQPSLDFQINWRPSWFGLDRRLTVSLLTVNFLGGLDDLLHGAGNLHGWGSATEPDPVLLYVNGFDPTTREFQYSVNGRFGSTVGANSGIITPFQIGLQAHFTIGPDPVRNRLGAAFGSRRNGGPGGPGGPGFGGAGPPGGVTGEDFAERFARVMPNPIAPILERRDSIHLSDVQVSRLQAISDSLDARNRALSDTLRSVIERAGDRPDPAVLFARIRPMLNRGREHGREALARARELLTPEQWGQLPESIRSPETRRRRDTPPD